MEAATSAIVFDETYVSSKEEIVSLVYEETLESLMDHYDEPSYFFRGAILAFLLCLPFWAVIYWLIS